MINQVNVATICLALLPLALAGCRQHANRKQEQSEQPPRVAIMKPERKTIRRQIGQPGMIEAFERTPIVARVPGDVLKWHVDINQAIKKDDVLAELFVPDMVS